jgi:hypothetical protein
MSMRKIVFFGEEGAPSGGPGWAFLVWIEGRCNA